MSSSILGSASASLWIFSQRELQTCSRIRAPFSAFTARLFPQSRGNSSGFQQELEPEGEFPRGCSGSFLVAQDRHSRCQVEVASTCSFPRFF